jgi:hypothetical protein
MMGSLLQCMSPVLCRFSDAGIRDHPRAPAAGVRKAPRHEIAGGERRWCRGQRAPRALWGFGGGIRQ